MSATPAAAANAKPASKGFFNGLFGKKSPSVNSKPVNVGKPIVENTSSNEAIAEAVQKSEINAAKATPSWLPTFLGGRTKEYGKMKPNNARAAANANAGANEYAHAAEAMKPNNADTFAARVEAAGAARAAANATGINESAVTALNASLNGKPANGAANAGANGAAAKRARTRKQRGGARGMTLRVPGPRNVLRVTGKTARKLGRVGVYGLKKVGNGVHVVTGLLGGLLKKSTNMVRKMTKRRQRR